MYSTSFFRLEHVNTLRYTHTHLDSKREAVHGESMGKALRDVMRLSSGLEYLEYVLVCTIVFDFTIYWVSGSEPT